MPGMTIGFEGKSKGFEDGLFERGLRQPQHLHHTRHRGGGRRGGRVYEPSVNHGQMRGFQDWDHSHARVDGSTRHWDGALGWRKDSPGRGIEYCWGKSKCEFCKNSNFVSGKENFKKRVMAALASVTLRRSQKYLRKANDYKRANRMLIDGPGVEAAAQYADIENMCALVKTHRCTFNQGCLSISGS